jgi:hypothetical protein
MRLFLKHKKPARKTRDPDEPTRLQRFREFGQRLDEASRERHHGGSLGQYGGMGMGAPAPPVDLGWERAEREAEEMDRKRAFGEGSE